MDGLRALPCERRARRAETLPTAGELGILCGARSRRARRGGQRLQRARQNLPSGGRRCGRPGDPIYGWLTLTIAHSPVPARPGSAPPRPTRRREPHSAAGQIRMEVSQTRSSTGPTHGRRAGSGRSGGTGFAAHVQRPSAGPAGIAAPSPLAALSTVLAAQQVQDGPGEQRRALARGRSLLDELDQIRIGLLEGVWSEASMRRLAELLQADRPAVSASKLGAVLDEIELRAAVELAKRQQVSPGRDEDEPARTPDSA
jgi:Class II flagellar assembly regulator